MGMHAICRGYRRRVPADMRIACGLPVQGAGPHRALKPPYFNHPIRHSGEFLRSLRIPSLQCGIEEAHSVSAAVPPCSGCSPAESIAAAPTAIEHTIAI